MLTLCKNEMAFVTIGLFCCYFTRLLKNSIFSFHLSLDSWMTYIKAMNGWIQHTTRLSRRLTWLTAYCWWSDSCRRCVYCIQGVFSLWGVVGQLATQLGVVEPCHALRREGLHHHLSLPWGPFSSFSPHLYSKDDWLTDQYLHLPFTSNGSNNKNI